MATSYSSAGVNANTADFFGEGTGAPVKRTARTAEEIEEEKRQRALADLIRAERAGVDLNGNPLPAYGTPISQGGTATQYKFVPIQLGQRDGGGTVQRVTRVGSQGTPVANAVVRDNTPVVFQGTGYELKPGETAVRPKEMSPYAVAGTDWRGYYNPDDVFGPQTLERFQGQLSPTELGEVIDTATDPTNTGPDPTTQDPAEVDRAKIDALLASVNKANSGLQGLAALDDYYSEAQAQLALGTAQAQNNSLALARSGNRRDSAALGARALQANAELGAEATRSSALLRAQEEEANKRLKLDAFKAAGDLGLNAAALELNAEELNMNAATNYLNQQFENQRTGWQIDAQEAQRITNYIRDMALLEKDYAALDMAERASVRDDLTRRYGISEGSKAALEQLEKTPGWQTQLMIGLVSGAGAGITGAIAASDKRVKEHVKDTTDQELEELLSAVKSKTYDYKAPEKHGQGRQFGAMAQDLKRSKVGAGMVSKSGDGTLMVDGGKAGMAALSAVALVYDKLKALEESL